ncbi:N-acetyltransferase B complex non catalytic subunit-domain-containing protein [Gilbertella persicaria]|uniref:N-acetyltransferase B complex non catalytic subunit-domain-containing protein n=1 Tax=Gilbertella persicaria TaxID=101096 RepID=UPI00221F9D6E|nr:N-acetyltransferase B complex non catalytic subunit-domain-containing protein [Gilbertella persicaria]KAI8048031.1 N-acetyltransferase B complex non catalytic subunit-domain-containing protein [Gilbertella persicaria]
MDYTLEKKLRPLYEALDEGQNKIALQHCTKLLKKNPDWPLVKALKALVLVRTGKEQEAFELCEQVKKVVPTDEATLQAVTMSLKELGKHAMIVELYENAANIQPKNEEFANHWFMAMVRNNDYKGQQAAAVKLHRVFKQNKYLFWAIMSLALQGATNTLSYVLAERMMAKALEENRLDQVEHMRLYLLILMDQKKNQEALKLLMETELGKTALKDPEVCQIKSELLRENQRWEQVLEMSAEALKENTDDWFHWLAYFEAVDALKENDQVIQDAHTLVANLQQVELNNKVLKRGPFLAQLDLDHRLLKMGKQDESVALDHIVSYFERFGSKNCAFEDLHAYILFLKSDNEKSKAFIERLEQTVQQVSDKSGQIRNVHKKANIRKMERFLGLHLAKDVEVAMLIVNDLVKLYQEALPLGEGLEKTEVQYGDEFVILAAHILLDLYYQHQQFVFLLQATALLEVALVKSVYNFQIKLLLVRMYTMMGVYKRPFEIYRTMEIKQIQFDTMIHYFTDRYASLGCVSELETLFYDSLSIYKSNEVETPEMLVKAYQYGTYSKIQEFIEFRRRLDTSLQHAITRVELLRSDFVHSSFQTKYAVQFFQEQDVSQLILDNNAFSDNRDMKVFINYNTTGQPTAETLSKPAQSTDGTWVQVMSFILTILSVMCETKESGRDLTSLADQFKALLAQEDIKQHLTESEFWLSRYVSELTDALLLIKQNQDAKDKLTQAIVILKDQLSKVNAFSEKTLSWNTFHQISTSLEAFNYGSVIIEMISRALGLGNKEAKRKATEKAGSDSLMASYVELQAQVKTSLQQIQTIARNGKDLFRAQLQKKLYKDLVDAQHPITTLKSTKEYQNVAVVHIKTMIASWSLSVAQLSEEIDRRMQKL